MKSNTVTIWLSDRTSLVFKWSKVVRFANVTVFKWLGCVITILMLRNCHSYVLPFEIRTGILIVQPFEYRTLKSPVFWWIRFSGVRYSNGYCTHSIFVPVANKALCVSGYSNAGQVSHPIRACALELGVPVLAACTKSKVKFRWFVFGLLARFWFGHISLVIWICLGELSYLRPKTIFLQDNLLNAPMQLYWIEPTHTSCVIFWYCFINHSNSICFKNPKH